MSSVLHFSLMELVISLQLERPNHSSKISPKSKELRTKIDGCLVSLARLRVFQVFLCDQELCVTQATSGKVSSKWSFPWLPAEAPYHKASTNLSWSSVHTWKGCILWWILWTFPTQTPCCTSDGIQIYAFQRCSDAYTGPLQGQAVETIILVPNPESWPDILRQCPWRKVSATLNPHDAWNDDHTKPTTQIQFQKTYLKLLVLRHMGFKIKLSEPKQMSIHGKNGFMLVDAYVFSFLWLKGSRSVAVETKHYGFTIDIKQLKCMLTYLQTAGFQHEFEAFKGSWFPLRSPMTRKPQTRFFFKLHSAKTAGNKSLWTQVLPSEHHKQWTRKSENQDIKKWKSAKQTNRNTKKRTSLLKPAEVHRDSQNTRFAWPVAPHRNKSKLEERIL